MKEIRHKCWKCGGKAQYLCWKTTEFESALAAMISELIDAYN